MDRERSSLDREIKAVTYHGLAIRSVGGEVGGYEATLVVDV
ncbi:MAG: archease [Phycisphaerae bacterium]|nr:archease [Phycisphaerae bacterium]